MLAAFSSNIKALCYEGTREFSSLVAYYTEELCCPQPSRCASPLLGRNTASRKRRSSLTSAAVELEVCQEIQQILFNCQPQGPEYLEQGAVDSHSEEESSPSSSSSPAVLLSRFNHALPFANTERREETILNDKHKLRLERRPRLGDSRSSIRSTRPEPVPTPPLRTHNPLPMNSPFVNRSSGQEGAEFGLLSVSPPPVAEDADLCARRNRVKRGILSSSQPLDESVNNNTSPSQKQTTSSPAQDDEVFCYPLELIF